MDTLPSRPAVVLGCTEDEAARLLEGRRVTPGEVDALAALHYDWRRHLRDPDSYWVTVPVAARLLRASPAAVEHLLRSGRVNHILHVSGVRLIRRHDLVRLRRPGRWPAASRDAGDARPDGGEAGDRPAR
jgi:hypothetical protein